MAANLESSVYTPENHVEMHLFCAVAITGYAELVFLPSINWGFGFFYSKRNIVGT